MDALRPVMMSSAWQKLINAVSYQAGFDWGDFVDGIASGGAKQRKQDTGEPFYGFTDFLRDLDVDLKRWSEQVDKKGRQHQN